MLNTPVLRVKDQNGNIVEIPAIKGDKGDPGDGEKTAAEIIDIIYPVGSIYMTLNAANPSVLFEGTTWEQIQGRFLFGAGNTFIGNDLVEAELGSTGGYYNAELIKHSHEQFYPSVTVPAGDGVSEAAGIVVESQWLSTSEAGTVEDGTGRNVPPYLAVNIWKRTA